MAHREVKSIKKGKIIGIELNNFFKINLDQLKTKIPNLEIKWENPLNISMWNQITGIDVVFNSLNLEAIKLFQATENSLKSAKDGARIINLYKANFLPENKHIQFAENFIQRLPLKSTQFLTIGGQLVSVSTKKGVFG